MGFAHDDQIEDTRQPGERGDDYVVNLRAGGLGGEYGAKFLEWINLGSLPDGHYDHLLKDIGNAVVKHFGEPWAFNYMAPLVVQRCWVNVCLYQERFEEWLEQQHREQLAEGPEAYDGVDDHWSTREEVEADGQSLHPCEPHP